MTFASPNLGSEGPYTQALNNLGITTPMAAEWRSLNAVIETLGPQTDVLLLYRGAVATHIFDIARRTAPSAKIVFHPVDLSFLRMEREATLTGDRELADSAHAMRAIELDLIRRADATIVVSNHEFGLLKTLVPGAVVHQMPILRDTPYSGMLGWRRLCRHLPGRRLGALGQRLARYSSDLDARRDFLFIGGYAHLPNVDAVLWFVREVWPRIQAKGYVDRFIIAGSNVPAEIAALASDRIEVRGHVADLASLFGASRLSVAPLRYGAGIKGKIVSSLSYGVPVVASSVAAEGMSLRHEEDILVADDPDLMADQIVRLYNDADLWLRLSSNGYEAFRNTFSEATGKTKVLAVFDSLARRRLPSQLRHALQGAAKLAWRSATLRKLRERIALRKIFDGDWYLATYPDVAATGLDPLSHYLEYGAAEGRDPGLTFSTRGYLQSYPDVAALGVNPLLHYVQFGRAEGRKKSDYDNWIRKYDAPTEAYLADLRRRGAELPHGPKISILMPTYNTPEALLREAISSVLAQTYENWELCVADDASTATHVGEVLSRYADPRIKVVFLRKKVRIALATSAAFELAAGEWVAMLDHDGVLAPHALFHVAMAINERPDVQLIYSDEDKIDKKGQRYDPCFKPDFSLELFRSQNYLNHLTVHRAANVRVVQGWRAEFEGSQDYDLNLRIIERMDPNAICHIPQVLYHWRAVQGSPALAGSEKHYGYAAGFRALQGHVERLALPARVEESAGAPFYRLRFAPPEPSPLVSIIIPTRDHVGLLRVAVSSILEKTTYDPFEILIVDNGSVEKETKSFLTEMAREPRIRVLLYPHPFNYSAMNNLGARAAKGEILALFNNDVEVISSDWLTEMVSWAAQEEIGCVGAKLYYPNDTIQHAGVILGIGGGVGGHSHRHFPRDHPGYFFRLKLTQNLSAVTAACMLVRKQLYFEVGGLDEEAFVVAINDIDFCLKVRARGHRNVWTPFAELYHHESASRGRDDTPEKRARSSQEVLHFMGKWPNALERDPFYSPHLTKDREDFSIRN